MAMGNIIKFIRFAISEVSPEVSEAEAKTNIADKLQNFLDERIIYARENIYHHCAGEEEKRVVDLFLDKIKLVYVC